MPVIRQVRNVDRIFRKDETALFSYVRSGCFVNKEYWVKVTYNPFG